MALSKQDLVSGLQEGLRVRSYLNNAVMSAGQMIEYIDKNLHDYGTDIKNLLNTTSKVGNNPMSVAELVAWCDYHLNVTVPNVIRLENRRPQPFYSLIRHKETGNVYAWRAGERPIFYFVKSADELHFLYSCHLSGTWDHIVDAQTNLVEFLHNELGRFAVDKSQMEAIIPPPPPETYTVAKGDTFGGIAKRLGMSVEALKAANPAVTNIDAIAEGQVLTVPK